MSKPKHKLTEYQKNILKKLSGTKIHHVIPIGLGKNKHHETT